MHGLAQGIVATEGKRQVAHPAAHLRTGQILLDPSDSAYEVEPVAVMLLYARGYRQDVGVENYILGRKTGFLREQPVGAPAHLGLALESVGLAVLVERHDHHSRTEAPYPARTPQKSLLPLLEGYGVDYPLPLKAFQRALYDLPF